MATVRKRSKLAFYPCHILKMESQAGRFSSKTSSQNFLQLNWVPVLRLQLLGRGLLGLELPLPDVAEPGLLRQDVLQLEGLAALSVP